MIIAITGNKFCGKSTVAELLHEELGWPVVSFAHKLKQITCILSGCTMDELEDYNFKETQLVPSYLFPYCSANGAPTYRNFLQTFGTKVMRGYNNDVWIESMFHDIPECVIVSDCRFLNEAEEIIARNGIIIRVERPSISSNDSHVSEQEMKDIDADVIIYNDCSIDELRDNIRCFIHDMLEGTISKEY